MMHGRMAADCGRDLKEHPLGGAHSAGDEGGGLRVNHSGSTGVRGRDNWHHKGVRMWYVLWWLATKLLKYLWPPEAFSNSGSKLYCHCASNKPKVILKNVDTHPTEEELEAILQTFTTEKVLVRRLWYRDTGKPLPVVKVTCPTEKVTDILLNKALSIRGRDIRAERFEKVHRREITCFSCREKGHIARSCPLICEIDSDCPLDHECLPGTCGNSTDLEEFFLMF